MPPAPPTQEQVPPGPLTALLSPLALPGLQEEAGASLHGGAGRVTHPQEPRVRGVKEAFINKNAFGRHNSQSVWIVAWIPKQTEMDRKAIFFMSSSIKAKILDKFFKGILK